MQNRDLIIYLTKLKNDNTIHNYKIDLNGNAIISLKNRQFTISNNEIKSWSDLEDVYSAIKFFNYTLLA